MGSPRSAGRERRWRSTALGSTPGAWISGCSGRMGFVVRQPAAHYSDSRNNGMVEKTLALAPREEIFAHTGILQFMQINPLIQLYAMRVWQGDPALDSARTLLMMPDLFNYWLTGVARSEVTIASTSQFYNPREKRWATGAVRPTGALRLADKLPPLSSAPGTFCSDLWLRPSREAAGLLTPLRCLPPAATILRRRLWRLLLRGPRLALYQLRDLVSHGRRAR